ncbi:MAG: hypothetical protein M1827_006763 [Pycnora praestabilis]|nr:MAG: hypothetical protein M1827_006763 [Pycnora praestabilis]
MVGFGAKNTGATTVNSAIFRVVRLAVHLHSSRHAKKANRSLHYATGEWVTTWGQPSAAETSNPQRVQSNINNRSSTPRTSAADLRTQGLSGTANVITNASGQPRDLDESDQQSNAYLYGPASTVDATSTSLAGLSLSQDNLSASQGRERQSRRKSTVSYKDRPGTVARISLPSGKNQVQGKGTGRVMSLVSNQLLATTREKRSGNSSERVRETTSAIAEYDKSSLIHEVETLNTIKAEVIERRNALEQGQSQPLATERESRVLLQYDIQGPTFEPIPNLPLPRGYGGWQGNGVTQPFSSSQYPSISYGSGYGLAPSNAPSRNGGDEKPKEGLQPSGRNHGRESQSSYRTEGTTGTSEGKVLYPDIKLQDKPHRFFVEGRVFLMLYIENAGENMNPGASPSNYSTVEYGEKAHVQIRRPITTYGRQATTKRGVVQDQHSIIYTGSRAPEKLAGETSLRKDPLQMTPVRADEKLDSLSRINFAYTAPIQYNWKVKKVGDIAPSSMPKLISYWKMEEGKI